MVKDIPLSLPMAIDSERLILGCALSGFVELSALETSLRADDFGIEQHRVICHAMFAIHQRGEGVSPASVYREIDARKLGKVALWEIINLSEGTPAIPDIDGFVKAVKNASIKRRLMAAGQGLINAASIGQETPELLESWERILTDLKAESEPEVEFVTPAEIIENAGGLGEYINRRSLPGIETPWPQFNKLTHGLHPKELIIVAAGTSRGKSAWALNLGYHAASRNHGVALYSMEMSREEINDRWICIAGRIDSYNIRYPQSGDRSAVIKAASLAVQSPIQICDRSVCTLASIENSLRRLRTKTQIDLVIVDYLNLMSSTGKSDNRVQEVSKLSRGLKLLAGEFNVPIIAVCQLNRNPMREDRPPELSDLRESGSIEQDANVVVFLHSTQPYQTGQAQQWVPADLIIAKQRNGVARIKIPIQFKQSWGVFEESTNEDES